MSKLHPFIKYSAITTVSLVVVYLFASFVTLSFSPGDCGASRRVLALTAGIIIWPFSLLTVAALIYFEVIGRRR